MSKDSDSESEDPLLGLDLSAVDADLAEEFERLLVIQDDAATDIVDYDEETGVIDYDSVFGRLIKKIAKTKDQELAQTVKFMVQLYISTLREQLDEAKDLQKHLRKIKSKLRSKSKKKTSSSQAKKQVVKQEVDETSPLTGLSLAGALGNFADDDEDVEAGGKEAEADDDDFDLEDLQEFAAKSGWTDLCDGGVASFLDSLLDDLEKFLPPLAVTLSVYEAALSVMGNVFDFTDFDDCDDVEFWLRVGFYGVFTIYFSCLQIIAKTRENVVKMSRRKVWKGAKAERIEDENLTALIASGEAMYSFDWAYIIFSFFVWTGIIVVFVDTTTLGCIFSSTVSIEVELVVVLLLVCVAMSRKWITGAMKDGVKEEIKEKKKEERQARKANRQKKKMKREQKAKKVKAKKENRQQVNTEKE